MTLAVPSFRDFLLNNRLTTTANEFTAAANLARSEAIKRGRNAYITSAAGTNWTTGWTVWVDNDSDDATQDANEVLRVTQAFEGNTTFTSTGKTQFRYSPSGLVDGAGTLRLCDSRTAETGREIDVSAAGRSNIRNYVCP